MPKVILLNPLPCVGYSLYTMQMDRFMYDVNNVTQVKLCARKYCTCCRVISTQFPYSVTMSYNLGILGRRTITGKVGILCQAKFLFFFGGGGVNLPIGTNLRQCVSSAFHGWPCLGRESATQLLILNVTLWSYCHCIAITFVFTHHRRCKQFCQLRLNFIWYRNLKMHLTNVCYFVILDTPFLIFFLSFDYILHNYSLCPNPWQLLWHI